MQLMDVILKRRSVRKYKNEDIPEDKIEKILQAGLLAPTSKNRKPCELFVVRDRETLGKLAEAKASGAGILAACNTAVVVLGNCERADTWIEDSSIALSYMDLMAASLDIGSCWCQIHLRSSHDGRDAEENVRKILSLPDKYRVVGIMSLGISAEEHKSHSLEDADFSKVRGWR